MRRTLYIPLLLALLRALAPATTYYVSSSSGSDTNSGTSSSAPWQTIAHVNAQTFQPGDSILFMRGDVWNESLVPPSSGTSSNPITFDAYGTGAPPNLAGYYPVPSSSWIFVSGNAWKAPLPSTYSTVNFCLFGSIWGQKVSAVSANLTAQWDFYFANGYVYVYSQGNPATYYNEPIVPMALSNTPVININNQSWLTFQHFLINWFDQYGVYVQGTSDHLVFANMEADSMVPQGTQPLGFYVNESAPGPGDIKIYNSEAHLNYDGFRFDGAATAITMINDKGYANRDGALVDNTGAVTYSYCHFYASSLAVAGSTDVEWTSGPGPNAGPGNIPQDTPPAVEVYQRYPAVITLAVDDAGMTPGADTYYADTVLPVAQTAGIPVGAAITVGYPLAQTLIPEFQSWIDQGLDVTSHSISHTYYTNTDAIDIQYIGSGTAATLSISNKTFTITVTGAPADSVTYNLAQGQPQGTMLTLAQALAATGKYTYSFLTPCQGPYGTGCSAYTAAALLAQDLADVSGQDVKTSVYHAQLDVTRLTTDEITLSRQWMTTNLTGLPSTPVYVYPGGYETTTMQGIAEGVPYSGARGALKEDFGVKDTYADGFNAQNVTSFGVNPTWMGIPPASLNQKIQALVWKESVWGVPWGIFWHLNELTQNDPVGGTEITNLINDFKNAGATVKTNTSLVNWLLTGTQTTGTDGNYYYKIPATGMTLDFRPTEDSPIVDAGQNLGSAYELDINGVNQNSYGSGWEIGAHVYQGYSTYGQGSGPGDFEIGGIAPALVSLPQQWVDNNEAFDGLFYSPPGYELNLGTQAWVTGPPAGCTFHLPYWTVGTPTFSGLQSAVNDIEACRTATGVGIALDIPPALYANPTGLVIPQTNSVTANNFLVLRSTADANLPDGQTICAHGIQDNLPTSTDIGLSNPDCTGQNMNYTLGPTEVVPATTTNNVNASQSASSICPDSVACLTTFTLPSGSSFASGFTPNTIVAGRGFGTSGDQQSNYNSQWIIVPPSGVGTNTIYAVPWGCFGPVNNCAPYNSSTNKSGTVGLAATATADEGYLQLDGTISGITTLSVNTTTLLPVGTPTGITTAILPTGTPVCVPLANGYVAPGVSLTVDTGANQETVTTQSGPCQKGMYVTLANAHAVGAPVQFCVNGCNYTLANGQIINTANYNDAHYMWAVEATGDGSALSVCNASGIGQTPTCATNIGPDHWLIEDGNFALSVGNTNDVNMVDMGHVENSTNPSPSVSQMSTHMHFRKDWAHGDWSSPYTGANSISAGFHLGATYFSLVDSAVTQALRPGAEGHDLDYGLTGQGKINHNWLEGSAIDSICGGLGASAVLPPGYLSCEDLEIRRNRLTFPYSWLGQSPIGWNLDPNFTSSFSLVRKDSLEFKAGDRIVITGNIYGTVDNSGAQNGPIGDFDTSNASGGGAGTHYNWQISDVYYYANITRDTCSGFEIGSRAQDGLGGTGLGGHHFFVNNTLFYSMTNTNPGCSETDNTGHVITGADNIGHEIGTYQSEWGGTVCPNVTYNGGAYTLPSGTNLVNCSQSAFTPTPGVSTFIATCISTGNNYNCPFGYGTTAGTGSAGTGIAASTTYSSGIITGTFTGSFNYAAVVGQPLLVADCSISAYNTASWAVTASSTSSITATASGSAALSSTTGCNVGQSYTNLPGPGGDQTDVAVGDPVVVENCANTNLNTPTISVPGYNGPGPGPGALAGTNGTSAYGVMVVYPTPNSGTGTAGDDACILNISSGFPESFLYTHNTMISDKTSALTSGHVGSFSQNGLFRDSMWVTGGGWQDGGGSVPEGTSTETVNWVVAELSNDHEVWVGRPYSDYTEYGNNPNYPDSAGCTGTGCNPPVTMYFPAIPYCTGATVSATPYTGPGTGCVGFQGAMSSSSMPLTLPDYHNYALRSDSPFYAGAVGEASDGTSMGVNIALLDPAQTANTFVCPWTCGSPGPYPDLQTAEPASTFFGFTENSTSSSNFPTVTYTMQRFWDSPPLQWPSINTAANTFDFSNLDTVLAQDYSNGITATMYTLARTPPWASSNPSDTTCAYTTASSGGGDGECDAPYDLNSDGSGTNATWKAWITAIASHVNASGYCTGAGATHACIKYWEIWNEPDTWSQSSNRFWAGTFAQLARLTEDANCIITGRGVVHESGNGTATPCTATPIDPTSRIVMASGHADQPALTFAQNQLYCNNTSGIPSGELPCPNPPNATAAAIDIVNFHMKPGNETGNNCPAPTPCTPESAMQMYIDNIKGILQYPETGKPLWDGEASYSSSGFTSPYTDADMAASFMPRFYLIDWSLGISGMAWYTSDQLSSEPAEVDTSYQQTYNWLASSALTTPCSAAGTVWFCGITKAGSQYLIMWDTSQSCSNGNCTTGNQTVGTQWTQYQDMTTASTPIPISNHIVPIGIKPVVLH